MLVGPGQTPDFLQEVAEEAEDAHRTCSAPSVSSCEMVWSELGYGPKPRGDTVHPDRTSSRRIHTANLEREGRDDREAIISNLPDLSDLPVHFLAWLVAATKPRWRNFRLACTLPLLGAPALIGQTIVLGDFNSGTASGAVLGGSSWVGQVAQNATSITVSGAATDQNGWFATTSPLNATGMNFIQITAQRDAGHTAPSFVVLFEDAALTLPFSTFSINASSFVTGVMTTVQIPISGWTPGFDPAQITGWSIGGGSPGLASFPMTVDHLSLPTTAIPEPGACAAVAGSCALGLAFRRRRKHHSLHFDARYLTLEPRRAPVAAEPAVIIFSSSCCTSFTAAAESFPRRPS